MNPCHPVLARRAVTDNTTGATAFPAPKGYQTTEESLATIKACNSPYLLSADSDDTAAVNMDPIASQTLPPHLNHRCQTQNRLVGLCMLLYKRIANSSAKPKPSKCTKNK
jgi:hypothetical protein